MKRFFLRHLPARCFGQMVPCIRSKNTCNINLISLILKCEVGEFFFYILKKSGMDNLFFKADAV